MTTKKFQGLVYGFYGKHGRIFPWRIPKKTAGTKNAFDPYRILVSEIMLQQTQTDRVVPKYEKWLSLFPTFKSLAEAKLQDVLVAWQGLGYNSRALRLKRLAEKISKEYAGKLPDSYEELLKLPGIGPYTAGAVMAFAFNKPIPIIETNIRTVFIHEFFSKYHGMIHDAEIMELVEKTLDRENPREWYWALMDYGAYIKKEHGNANARSRHYAKQSAFKGSNREIRSAILRKITSTPSTLGEILKHLKNEGVAATKAQVLKNTDDLIKEGFINYVSTRYAIL